MEGPRFFKCEAAKEGNSFRHTVNSEVIPLLLKLGQWVGELLCKKKMNACEKMIWEEIACELQHLVGSDRTSAHK